jgi:hypothetical protein
MGVYLFVPETAVFGPGVAAQLAAQCFYRSAVFFFSSAGV